MPKCPNAKMLVRLRIPKCKNAQIHTHLPVMTSSMEQRASRRCLPPPQPSAKRTVADLHASVMSSSKEPRASRTRPPARSSTPARYPSSAAGCWMAAAVGKGGREGSNRGVGTWEGRRRCVATEVPRWRWFLGAGAGSRGSAALIGFRPADSLGVRRDGGEMLGFGDLGGLPRPVFVLPALAPSRPSWMNGADF
jgi:hypothetical protein